MNKAAILIAIFTVLGSLEVARAQLALSSYVCEAALSQSPCIQSSCKPCSSVFISRVLSSDGKVLPYTYSFCSDDGSISLDVGIKEYQSHTFFSFNCADNLFVALDPTKSTLAAQFYLHCLDGLIYKCPPGRVFEEKLARCIPAYQPLESGLEYCAKTCGDPVFPIGISAVVCESNLYNTLPPVCSSCYTPYTVPAITTSCEAVPGFYTFCAENGRFSLDIGCENKVHTYFTPYCTGNNPLQPIDASKKSIASKLFWDCRVGLVACEGDYVFDPVRNRCSKSWYSLEAYEYEDVCYKACPAPHFEELYLGGEGVGSKTGASRLQTSSRLSGNALSNFATTGGASIRPGLTGGPAGLFRSAITPGPTAPTARLATPGPTAPTARLATPGPSASASRPATPESTSNPKP